MRKLSSLFTGVALTLSVGLIGCSGDDGGDPFDSLNPTTTTVGDGDGDGDTSTGDGDGDPTTTGDGDGDPTTGDGDGDPACGGFGEACCAGAVCDDTLACDANNTCGVGGGDGDGDGDPDPMLGDCLGDDAWCPISAACTTGMFLSLQGDPVLGAYAWCAWNCDPQAMDLSMCPVAPAGTQAACLPTSMDDPTQGGCGLACQVANDTCPEGSACFELQPGTALCMYDNPNN